MTSADLVNQYVQELRGLTFNSKPIINTLTMIASENKAAAAAIAAAVEARINSSAPAHKLPALYLLDSIVKNIGLPYTALFASSLPQVYMSVWLANPSVRPALSKLYNTWQRYFPEDVLTTISQRQNAPEQAPPELRQPHYPSAAPSGQQQYQHQAPYAAHEAPRPASWGSTYATAPQPQHSGQLPPGQPSPAYGPHPYQAGASAQPGSNPYTSAYTPTYPQPQYAHGPSPSHPSSAQSTPAYGTPGGSADASALLSQLLGAGVIGRDSGLGAAVAGSLPVAPVVLPRVFNLSKYKDWSETALKQLMDSTAATHSKFLDRGLHKKQRRAAGAKSSRQYYVKETDWLAGTSAVAQAVPAFFEDDAQVEDEEAVKAEASVPADPDQKECGISGESFDSFWDDATSGWRYKDATAVNAEQAARYGLVEGALVKISCLEPAVSSDIRAADETVEAAEGQAAAENLAAAAEDETTDPALKADDKADAKDVEESLKKHNLEGPPLEESPKRQKTDLCLQL